MWEERRYDAEDRVARVFFDDGLDWSERSNRATGLLTAISMGCCNKLKKSFIC